LITGFKGADREVASGQRFSNRMPRRSCSERRGLLLVLVRGFSPTDRTAVRNLRLDVRLGGCEFQSQLDGTPRRLAPVIYPRPFCLDGDVYPDRNRPAAGPCSHVTHELASNTRRPFARNSVKPLRFRGPPSAVLARSPARSH
jgi:hypothetical protein